MEADPIEGMARVICAAPHEPDDVGTSVAEAVTWHEHQSRAAWAYALATLRAWDTATDDDRLFLDAFAAAHGLTMPHAGPQEPPGRDSGLGSGDATSDAPTHADEPWRPASGDPTETTTKDQP